MGFDFIKKLPTPEEIRNQFPIDAELQAIKDARDKELKDVFTGKSDKFLAIIGPCSADNEDSVLDYLTRLRKVQEKIADKVPASIPISRVPQAKDTKVWYISQIRKNSQISLQVLLRSAKCISTLFGPVE